MDVELRTFTETKGRAADVVVWPASRGEQVGPEEVDLTIVCLLRSTTLFECVLNDSALIRLSSA